jgi:anti-sigma factor RsiW
MKCCDDFKELISLYLDGELGGSLLSALEEHFAKCEHCVATCRTVKKTIVLSRQYFRLQYRAVPKAVSERVFFTLRVRYHRK